MHANNEVYILFLTVFSIGIAIGSLLCDTLLKGQITLKLAPFVLLGVSLFTYLMIFASPEPPHEELLDASAFLAIPQHWPILGSMLMVAVCGGIYLVPLYAMLQSHTPAQYRSRVMAASNLSDSVFMTVVSIVCAILLSKFGIWHYRFISGLSQPLTCRWCGMLEKLLLRPVLTFLLKLFFRVEVTGMEHYRAAGDRVLIAVNHQSFLDPLLVAVFLPRKPAFSINVFQADKWYFRWLDKITTLYRLDPSKPLSMKHLIQDLRKGAKVVIFPEGRISTGGGIMKIYDGTGMIIEKTGATVLPVRIENAEYSKVSRLSHKLRQRWFPKIRMTILPPVRFEQGSLFPAASFMT